MFVFESKMDKTSFDKLQIATTSEPLQGKGSATGNPRNKCALKPGHSLMDWIRLGNSGTDLSGTGGRLISVSKEELIKHNTRNDAWIVIGGVVYNVTRYMDFHPGGVEELMRGVGTDATKLFNETHAWVNYSQLLNKCRIGTLTNTVKLDANIAKLLSPPIYLPSEIPSKSAQQADVLPRLDWIQKRDNVILYFYTRQFCNPGFLVHNFHNGNCIDIWIFIDAFVHKFSLELLESIQWPPANVQLFTESGKIEIKLKKCSEHLWNELGKYTTSKVLADTMIEVDNFLEFKMLANKKFNHDSFCMALKNGNLIYCPPVGYHLTIENIVNCIKMCKCYTPVPKPYAGKYLNFDNDMDSICFLIKHYSYPNSFSQYLCDLEPDSRIKVSLPQGKIKLSVLAGHTRFCFLAAGSGLTPFLNLIDHLLKRNTNRIEVLKLYYFNKTISDIWCNEVLTNISRTDGRFELLNVLSNADESWSGLKGRVSLELLLPIVNKSMENISYIAACGPSNFITRVENILSELNFPKQNLFIF